MEKTVCRYTRLGVNIWMSFFYKHSARDGHKFGSEVKNYIKNERVIEGYETRLNFRLFLSERKMHEKTNMIPYDQRNKE